MNKSFPIMIIIAIFLILAIIFFPLQNKTDEPAVQKVNSTQNYSDIVRQAIEGNNPDLCGQLEAYWYNDSCHDEVARVYGKDQYNQAIESLDPELCKEIPEYGVRVIDECYYKIAMLKNDSAICALMQTISVYWRINPSWYNKDVCYTKFAILNNDTSLCLYVDNNKNRLIGNNEFNIGRCKALVSEYQDPKTKHYVETEFLDYAP